MEIPVINRMSELEAISINSLNNPSSLITRVIAIFELGRSSLPHRLWKWGPLFVAFLYALTSLAYKVKLLILHYHSKSKSLLSSASHPLLHPFDDEFTSSDDEIDDVSSSSDDEDVEEEEEEVGPSPIFEDLARGGEGTWGICDLSLKELMNRNGVVRVWGERMRVSPMVVYTAGEGEVGGMGFGIGDLRMRRGSAVVNATWRAGRRSSAVSLDPARTGKVYVRDDVMGVAVGDVRRWDKAVEELREDMWWDADELSEDEVSLRNHLMTR